MNQPITRFLSVNNMHRTIPRVIALSQQNAGPTIARNRGLDIAKGEYVYFADSDDRLELNLVESMLIRLEETSTKMAFMQSLTKPQAPSF